MSIRVDFHQHCLPRMDDGAADVTTSLEMLRLSGQQGVETVVATPHFYAWKESVHSFLARREASVSLLHSVQLPAVPRVLLGAEVQLVHDLSQKPLEPLIIENTQVMLLELPFMGYEPWMAEEAENIAYTFSVQPVLAHLDRYLPRFSKRHIAVLLSIPDVIVQLNAESLLNRHIRRFAYTLAEKGQPLLLGSDAHNLTSRRSPLDQAEALLRKESAGQRLLELVENTSASLGV